METRPESPSDPDPSRLRRLYRARSHHGTWLARDAGGALRLTAREDGPELAVLVVLDTGRIFLDDGHPDRIATLRLSEPGVDGPHALRLDDGRRLTATPHAGVELGEGPIADWERFSLEPLERPFPPGLSALLATGIAAATAGPEPDLARLAQLCAAPPPGLAPAAELCLLCACVDALPEDRLRELIPTLRRRSCWPLLFHAVQARLSDGRRRTEWDTRAHLAPVLDRPGWRVGDHTYGAPEIIDGEYGTLRIGRYCSIAGGVRIVVANHTTRSLTTYPFTALRRFWPSAAAGMADHVGDGVVIGNAVWIGAGVCLLPGARIGDGAVIGAHAVVAGEVAPYAVVVGNPGRTIRVQHRPDTVERLLEAAWWDWPDHEVDAAIPLLLADDPAPLLAHAAARRDRAAAAAPAAGAVFVA